MLNGCGCSGGAGQGVGYERVASGSAWRRVRRRVLRIGVWRSQRWKLEVSKVVMEVRSVFGEWCLSGWRDERMRRRRRRAVSGGESKRGRFRETLSSRSLEWPVASRWGLWLKPRSGGGR